MPTLQLHTFIKAPPERCFDAARDITLHCRTASFTGERAIAGRTSGKINAGESVTFRARHLGVQQRLTARVVEFEPPHFFTDEMTRGAFASMRHRHEFAPVRGGTLMRDTLQWRSPLGILGRMADALIVKPHLRRFLLRRNRALKRIIERESLPPSAG